MIQQTPEAVMAVAVTLPFDSDSLSAKITSLCQCTSASVASHQSRGQARRRDEDAARSCWYSGRAVKLAKWQREGGRVY